ncbi:MAG: selenium-dependent molybdenum cofactor biosynthesis protein YqeB [Acidaminobacteraceae bacterium]
MNNLVIVRGAGDLATGIIKRLSDSGFKVIALEVEKPSMIRRTVSLAQCVYDGSYSVEGLTSVLINNDCDIVEKVNKTLQDKKIPVIVDPVGEMIKLFKPKVVVDAILAKKNLGTTIDMADVVIGMGPGFEAKVDVDAVVETMRGHDLGRVIYQGSAIKDTGIPGLIAGEGKARVIKSPIKGIVTPLKNIGDNVVKGEIILKVDDVEVEATLTGVLRGMIMDGYKVKEGFKIADIDPREVSSHCYTVSDKARTLGGAVLEAVLKLGNFIS